LLSGYAPSAEAVEAVGAIARDLKRASSANPGSFFWGEPAPFNLDPRIHKSHAEHGGGDAVLDPVMGDNGRLYVSETVVPVYRTLLHDADLILPNQFEAEYASSSSSSASASSSRPQPSPG